MLGCLALAGVCISIVTLFLRTGHENDGIVLVKRKDYYNHLLETYLPPVGTPQDQAIEWLAFHDDPLQTDELFRLNQRYALVVIYYSHGGPATWTTINDSASGWVENGAGLHECQWRGVDCNLQKEVTGLRLSSEEGISLTGSQMATEIGMLSKLESLFMADQRLQGTIPADWKTLKDISILDLRNNELRSTIPVFFGDFPKLKSLLLAGNLLSGSIPALLQGSTLGTFPTISSLCADCLQLHLQEFSHLRTVRVAV